MKIAVCEDHSGEARWLLDTIEQWAAKTHVVIDAVSFASVEEFLFHYSEKPLFDALFLDIQMPGQSGISLAKKLREQGDGIPIVFVTGLDEYISDGYELEALHYLVKPVQREKVFFCLDKICERAGQQGESLLLNTGEGVIKMSVGDVVMVEVFGHQCMFHTLRGDFLQGMSLQAAQKDLPAELFVPCYRGILVNLQHVESIRKNEVSLTGGVCAPVSRRLSGKLNQAFIRFYRNMG